MSELNGINLAMQTPTHADGSIDYRRWEALIDTYIDAGVGISVSLFERLNQLEHFNYIKDSGGDLTVHQRYLATGYKVLNGCDPAIVFSFIAGAPGCIWGGANYMPRESVGLFERLSAGDIDGAMQLRARMIPSLLFLWEGNYIPRVKAACRLRGLDGGGVRAPLRPVSAEEEQRLIACLAPLDREFT